MTLFYTVSGHGTHELTRSDWWRVTVISDTLPDYLEFYQVGRTRRGTEFYAVWLQSDGRTPRHDFINGEWRVEHDSPILRVLAATVERFEAGEPGNTRVDGVPLAIVVTEPRKEGRA